MDRIEKYALENDVPIMQKEGILFLKDYIVKNNIKNILEIGSAIGYSACQMASTGSDVKIVTIERDELRYHEAVKNINELGYDNQIDIILADALEVEINGKFDMIFIDAAKAQYIKFFEKFKYNLSDNGVIISDNLSFHGLTEPDVVIKNRNLRQLVRKINNYKQYLLENSEFKTEFYDIGDGITVSKRN
ncbi:MAG: O-methyltransferase [Bacilli bacterium]|nr:O-methyltransferase [Bacilli bacterium]